MDRNKLGNLVVLIVFLLIVAVAIWFLFFRDATDVTLTPPPATATTTSPGTTAQPPPLPELIEQQEFYDTGELRSRCFVYRERPEVKHGQYHEFYPSQARKLICEYVEGKVQGNVQHWYENGQEAMRGEFRDGLRDGPFVEFHHGGNAKLEATFRAGQPDGAYREYYDAPNQPVMIEKTYADGILSAPTVVRKLDGTVKYTVSIAGEQTGTAADPEAAPSDRAEDDAPAAEPAGQDAATP